ncbi:ATP-binding protein [Oscillospiraceae bacterium MB08-C2-2]|nr:ATP-binding protein [Oscillospiraceae bacterium MB08-C2-2]
MLLPEYDAKIDSLIFKAGELLRFDALNQESFDCLVSELQNTLEADLVCLGLCHPSVPQYICCRNFPEFEILMGQLIAENAVCRLTDSLTESLWGDDLETFMNQTLLPKIQGGIALTIDWNAQPIGILLCGRKNTAWSPQEHRLLKHICCTISLAVDNYMALETFQSQNRELLSLSQQHLSKAQAEAENANQSKQEFLSRMSHEFRTPVNAIIGMAGIAADSESPEKVKECLKQINHSSRHLLELINGVLDMSQIAANQLTLDIRPFDFDAMLAEISLRYTPEALKKGHTLTFQLDPKTPRYFRGDDYRLAQVIGNLLSNAIKFTPTGGTVQVNVREITRDNIRSTIAIAVSDNGIGIAQDQHPTLFTYFEQGEGGSSRHFEGVGLGLTLCKSIVKMMEGDITVVSKEGMGSVFTFVVNMDLWLNRPEDGPPVLCDNVSRGTPEASCPPLPVNPRGYSAVPPPVACAAPTLEQLADLSSYVDMEKGLSRILGNKAIYITLLKSFANSPQIPQLYRELSEEENEAAIQTVHTIKGMTGNLSLPAAYNAAVLLEAQLKNNRPAHNSLDAFRQVMEKTLLYISALLEKLKNEV